MKKVLVCCGLLRPDLERLIASCGVEYDTNWLESGLHNWPERLREELQALIDSQEDAEEITLAFGLCGNALIGLKATTAPVRYLGTDDCISAMLCENENLLEMRRNSLFTNKSWLASPASEDEQIKRAIEKYGEDADWIIDELYKNYENLVYMQTEETVEEEWVERSKQLAQITKTKLAYCPANYHAYEALLADRPHPLVKLLPKGEELKMGDFYSFVQ